MVSRFNLAYLDRCPEYRGVQETYPFILYALGQLAREQVSLEVVLPGVFLPSVAEVFIESEYHSDSMHVLDTRVLWPLCEFGLLTLTPERTRFRDSPSDCFVQLTPLFEKMVHFDFEAALAPV